MKAFVITMTIMFFLNLVDWIIELGKEQKPRTQNQIKFNIIASLIIAIWGLVVILLGW